VLTFFVPQELGSEGQESVLGLVREVSFEDLMVFRWGMLYMRFLVVNGMRIIDLRDRLGSKGEMKS
jgi:hypothetical protein